MEAVGVQLVPASHSPKAGPAGTTPEDVPEGSHWSGLLQALGQREEEKRISSSGCSCLQFHFSSQSNQPISQTEETEVEGG